MTEYFHVSQHRGYNIYITHSGFFYFTDNEQNGLFARHIYKSRKYNILIKRLDMFVNGKQPEDEKIIEFWVYIHKKFDDSSSDLWIVRKKGRDIKYKVWYQKKWRSIPDDYVLYSSECGKENFKKFLCISKEYKRISSFLKNSDGIDISSVQIQANEILDCLNQSLDFLKPFRL